MTSVYFFVDCEKTDRTASVAAFSLVNQVCILIWANCARADTTAIRAVVLTLKKVSCLFGIKASSVCSAWLSLSTY